ncbi:MAG: alpha/beta hydrolase [Clostridiales bacterium]|nr:alpha/beta hydrolase [Clostridiales bacterium]
MSKKRKAYILSCEVSAVENVVLGGYRQKIAIEGKSKNLPVVICLHGGPGTPIPFSVGCRGLFPDITDRLIMVYWDQLGCGINNRKIDNSFTIDHFVNMTIDLIKEIKARFTENKLYLYGMSWGSILALKSAIQVPDLIDGVVTYGQVLTAPMFSDNAFDAVENSSAPEKKKKLARALRAKRPNLSVKEVAAFSKIIRKYTDGYNNRASESAPVGEIILGLMFGPDYGFKDFSAIVMNGYMKNESLIQEMSSVDLTELFSRITVPYLILQGDTDVVTDTENVVKAVERLNNKNVSCTVLHNAGHLPSAGAMNVIFENIYNMTDSVI